MTTPCFIPEIDVLLPALLATFSETPNLADKPLHPLPPRIDHEDASIRSHRDIVGKAELAILVSEPAKAGEDPTVKVDFRCS